MKPTDQLTPDRRQQLADLNARIKKIEAKPSADPVLAHRQSVALAALRGQRRIILEPVLRPQAPEPERRQAAVIRETRTTTGV